MGDVVTEELVTANRMLANEGIFTPLGHVSARTRDGDHFYLNEAMCPAVVTTDDLMVFDLDGEVIEGDPESAYKEVEIHRAIYANREDVNAVVHHHAEDIMPYTISHVTFDSHDGPDRPAAAGSLPTFSDYGPTNGRLIAERAEGKRMADNLGDFHAQFLERHGANVVGGDVQELVANTLQLNRFARLHYKTEILGGIDFIGSSASAFDPIEASKAGSSSVPRMWQLQTKKLEENIH